MSWIWPVVIVVVLLVLLLPQAVRIVKEYERAVIFRLGRYVGVRGPGWVWLIPFVERPAIVDLRVVTMDVPTQEAITRDNVTVRVNAVVFFRVLNAQQAVIEVEDYIRATSQISQTTLRSVVGQSELDEVLGERDKINRTLARIIDESTDPWGIKVSVVEMKEVELPETMKRAIAAQAEAERERRAKIIHAQGEFEASQKLADAGRVIAVEPIALQLRYLQTLTEVASERNSTLIFPIPIDLVSMFMANRGQGQQGGGSTT